MYANFLLGELIVTPAAQAKLKREPLDLLARHAVNEHGNLQRHELQRNLDAMATCGQIFSRYPADPTDATQGNVLVITDEGWGSTTVQLEEEE